MFLVLIAKPLLESGFFSYPYVATDPLLNGLRSEGALGAFSSRHRPIIVHARVNRCPLSRFVIKQYPRFFYGPGLNNFDTNQNTGRNTQETARSADSLPGSVSFALAP